MTDDLTRCLEHCANLAFRQVTVTCPIVADFRKAALRFLVSAKALDAQTLAVRRRLWRLVYRMSEAPLAWSAELHRELGFETLRFSEVTRRHFGPEPAWLAEHMEQLWEQMQPAAHGAELTPLESAVRDAIRPLQDDVAEFRILASAQHQAGYARVLEQLELTGTDLFVTAPRLKSQRPMDTLVCCGPFRDDCDLVFTAPRWRGVLNIRWTGDSDIRSFPNYLSLSPSDSSMFPPDFPCRVTTTTETVSFDWQFQQPASRAIEQQEWNFDRFEELFLTRRVRRRQPAPVARRPTPEHRKPQLAYKFVRLTFFDGSSWIRGFDQQGLPPLIYSLTEDAGSLAKRRPAIDITQDTDDWLLPGMMVVVESDATEDLAARARAQAAAPQERRLLRRWKRKLDGRRHRLQPHQLQAGGRARRVRDDGRLHPRRDVAGEQSSYRLRRRRGPGQGPSESALRQEGLLGLGRLLRQQRWQSE